MPHYVWAEAHRRTRSVSRSRSRLVKWRAHEPSNSLSPGWSAELLCTRGSAVATHTRVSQAERKQTQKQPPSTVTIRSITFKVPLNVFFFSMLLHLEVSLLTFQNDEYAEINSIRLFSLLMQVYLP